MEIVASYLNPWPNASEGAKAFSYQQLHGLNPLASLAVGSQGMLVFGIWLLENNTS